MEMRNGGRRRGLEGWFDIAGAKFELEEGSKR
jgi:hypothetical protein